MLEGRGAIVRFRLIKSGTSSQILYGFPFLKTVKSTGTLSYPAYLTHPCVSRREILTTEEQKREVIELFNFHWRDCRYRDFGAQQKYSALQTEYFNTPPGERQWIIERIVRGDVPVEEDVGSQREVGKTIVESERGW